MARDRTARTRIRDFLVEHGPLDDPSGHATGALKDAIAYEGSAVAFIQLVAAMDRDGEITRDIRGKRTYRICAARDAERAAKESPREAPPGDPEPTAPMVLPSEAGPLVLDYDKLARAIVRELWASLSPLATAAAASAPSAAADELRVERERMIAERDSYARRLELARAQLDEVLGEAPASLRS